MAVGYAAQKTDVDARAGQLSMLLRNTFRDVVQFKAWLDAQSDAQLTALGYNSADLTLLKASFTDLSNLRDTAYGLRAQSPASNFFFNAQWLTGVQ
jgi:hypothetical protein